jgi:serine/threonine protein phosphatase PrpC
VTTVAATGLTAQVIGRSVRGASHVRTGRTNQDAIAWSTPTADGLVVAVADGHGSDKSFRSERGSRLAVTIAVTVLAARLHRPGELTSAGPDITARWVHDVRAELAQHPPTSAELAGLNPRERADLAANPLLAYGTTVLAAAISPGGVQYLQLGDGDIVFVARDGSAWVPLPEDRRNAGNQTLSLCLPSAAGDFRYGTAGLDEAPRMILLSSDGFANSYQNEPAFLKFGTDLLAMIDRGGIPAVEPHLEEWLRETTDQGAGDDVTLAVVVLDLPPGAGRATAPRPPEIPPTLPLDAPPVDNARDLSYPAATLGPTQKRAGAVRGATGQKGQRPLSAVVPVSTAPVADRPERGHRLLVTGLVVIAGLVVVVVLGLVVRPWGGDRTPAVTATTKAPPATSARPAATRSAVSRLIEPTGPRQVRCGTGVCLLDDSGTLFFETPAGGDQQQLSGPGWTRLRISGDDVVLSRDGDARTERVAIPDGGGVAASDSGPGGANGGTGGGVGGPESGPEEHNGGTGGGVSAPESGPEEDNGGTGGAVGAPDSGPGDDNGGPRGRG